ncbi:MAG: FAD-dependent monooxygenase [Pseudomonadota bacterium]
MSETIQHANQAARRAPCISNALIIGGGVAGLSAAIALSRVGVRCDVVELVDGPPLGASLGLSGRAADALAELGIYDACHATSTPFENDTKAQYLYDATGRVLSTGPKRPSWPGAKTALGVYRPALAQIMEDAARGLGATIRKGITAQTIEEGDDASWVTLTDGSRRAYELVIGADGIGSATRAMVFPEAPAPAYSGQISIRWMLSGPAIEDEGWYASPAGKVGFYHLPENRIYVPAVLSMPEQKRLSGQEVHALFSELLDSFTAPAVLELRRRLTPDSDLICRPFTWILLPQPWHRGRTLLIGDAAHATTAHMGMGGGMAIEDAVVLAQCIAGASDLAGAFDSFMARRYERVRTVVETSAALSLLEQDKAPPADSMKLLGAAFETIGQPY